ncbi:lysylphosphatidylglycerol synthase transmembrane domain-containing protein [Thalassospira lucentensis]|uniref:lysylphosphatidylglycerol synthase transmembrane domain-containing protein n=1 Tax=Thalassospira lucentensis TaxID=168935 RepID=UPI0029421DC1|nr:lysylphosphatidylglycerol synthase transmembrane domain-containing protein [Thalassospira lucentensis]WOI11820.1 lysylphosphatidylglycerol synthase transmembrane domain-containing protein [Thalassospira lucentensis]
MQHEIIDEVEQSPKRGMHYLVLGVKLSLSVGLVVYLATYFDFEEIVKGVAEFPLWSVVAAFAVLFGQVSVNALRCSRILVFFDYAKRWLTVFRITWVGFFYAQTMISFVGGDSMRIWQFTRRQLPFKVAAEVVLMDRISGMVVQLTFMILSLPVMLFWVEDISKKVVLLLLCLAGIVGLVCLAFFRRIPAVVASKYRLIRAVGKMSDNVFYLLNNKRLSVQVLFLSSVIVLMNVTVIYTFSQAIGIGISYWEILVLTPSVFFLSMMPISIAGWGVRESAMAAAFTVVGVPVSQTILVSVAYGMTLLLVSLPGSLLLFSKSDLNSGKKKDVTSVAG